MTDKTSFEGWRDMDSQLHYLGPVGFWRWTYRVSIRDVSPYDGPAEFKINLQRKKGKNWHSVKPFGSGTVTLYAEGEERDGTLNDRTEPSESERERLAELREIFGF